jgi:hypothetical protein
VIIVLRNKKFVCCCNFGTTLPFFYSILMAKNMFYHGQSISAVGVVGCGGDARDENNNDADDDDKNKNECSVCCCLVNRMQGKIMT